MLLALDIGNTVTTIGVFEGDELRANWRISTDVRKLRDEYAMLLFNLLWTGKIDPADVSKCSIASVVPTLTPVFEDLARRYFDANPLVVGSGVRTGMRIVYDNPREVGADRVVDAVAAQRLYGPPPLIVVDLGTATVLDAINAAGDYVGGAIAPGLSIASEALFERASKLYRVELEPPRNAIGRNTVEAMRSGLVLGAVATIEGLVARFKQELGGEAKVIATGGWAEMMAKQTTSIDIVDRHLTLAGLRMLYEMNRGEPEPVL
ncbi:MAG TPA: type III pantothenate kinase [Dehalococcoidia bacterium]|nr:type III pantothenate kinase [Dehalococcoidia bacterium]